MLLLAITYDETTYYNIDRGGGYANREIERIVLIEDLNADKLDPLWLKNKTWLEQFNYEESPRNYNDESSSIRNKSGLAKSARIYNKDMSLHLKWSFADE